MNAISSAAAGMISAIDRFDSSAITIGKASNGQAAADPAAAVVDEVTAQAQLKAATATLGVADQMLKSLLDITV
jgi:hypothetical protein